MKVTNIIVRAGRTFNHPHEQYSNLKPEVELRAELAEGDNPAECAKALQAQAEGLVEDHKQGLLKSINELYEMTEKQTEMIGLQRQLTQAQSRLDEIRRQHPGLAALPGLSAPSEPEFDSHSCDSIR
jgi:hypothetical protein